MLAAAGRSFAESLERTVARLPPPLQAAVWMTMGAVAFAGMSGVIRHLASEMHPFVVAFHRSLFALLWMLPWILRHGRTVLRTRRPLFYTVRSGFQLVSMMASFYGVAYMAIADATAISFTGPLFATVGAALILGERVRVRRWVATLIGFVGVIVVVRPGPETFNPVGIALATKRVVILALVARIHAFASACRQQKAWMLGPSPSMTVLLL